MKLSQYEAFFEKRFKKKGFRVIKIDNNNAYKTPDFKLIKGDFLCLCEVKLGLGVGKRIREIIPSKAFQYEPEGRTFDYFEEANIQYKDYISTFPKDKKLPYVLCFYKPFFIQDVLRFIIPSSCYKTFPNISAVLISELKNPQDEQVKNMTFEEIERFIFDEDKMKKMRSQNQWTFEIIPNKYAKNKLPLIYF